MNHEFKVLTWPPNSPDLNPIEHLWDVLDKQVRSMEAPPRNLQDLKDLLLMSCCQIPQHTFRGLVESMPRRVRAVLGAIHYIRQVVIMLWLIGVYIYTDQPITDQEYIYIYIYMENKICYVLRDKNRQIQIIYINIHVVFFLIIKHRPNERYIRITIVSTISTIPLPGWSVCCVPCPGVLRLSCFFSHSVCLCVCVCVSLSVCVCVCVCAGSGRVYQWGTGLASEARRALHPDPVPAHLSAKEPSVVPGLEHVTAVAVAAGSSHCVCLAAGGAVLLWGSNRHGQLGAPLAGPFLSRPRSLDRATLGGGAVVAVWSGWTHLVAKTESGRVFTWGRADYGQLGRPTTANGSPGPGSHDVPGELRHRSAETAVEVKGLSAATQGSSCCPGAGMNMGCVETEQRRTSSGLSQSLPSCAPGLC
ncbi:uncharacterized protein sergef isoform X2 [Amia ocellicauda]|uniref:uncharacterized protein sergef isoform X2 n=1 Tax=Amia ocellicauda TaxID=2972642 RepID=UPI0034644DEE